jgi:polyprenyl-phospho-N-acetylgalactosaminyl synthase
MVSPMSIEPSLTPDQMDSVWIVVPAYNEEGTIREVLLSLLGSYRNVIVVDDCSIDSTGALARAAGARLVRHPVNLGQGAALQTGITLALQIGAGYVVTFDADGQHHPEDIAGLLAALARSGADFALGSRFLGTTTRLDLARRLLLKAAALFSRITTGLNITDAHNGLRAFTRRGASELHIRQNRMAHASEILHQIAKSRLNWVEVPVTIDYTLYSKAKGQRLSNAVNILLELLSGTLHR